MCSPGCAGISKLRLADFYERQNHKKAIPRDRLFSLDDESLEIIDQLNSSEVTLDDVLSRVEACRLANLILGALNPDEREVLLLRYAEELSYRDIANVMHRSEKATERLLARAREKAARIASKWIDRDGGD